MRSSVGMDLKSSLGNFRMSYSDAVSAANPGGMGKGSAQAVFNSSTFGGGKFNFSAVTALGGGSARGGGFSAAGMGANDFGNSGAFGGGSAADSAEKHPASSLTMRMSF
jgi:hypothetical protein